MIWDDDNEGIATELPYHHLQVLFERPIWQLLLRYLSIQYNWMEHRYEYRFQCIVLHHS